MAIQRVQIPISFSYQTTVSGTSVNVPASGVTVSIVDRTLGQPTTVYSSSTGSGVIVPVVTDSGGNVPGWVVQGSYTVQAAASGSFGGAAINWEAVRGDGVENIYPGAVTATSVAANSIGTNQLASQVTQALLPTGSIIAFAGTTAPAGFVLANGASYATNTKSMTALFALIGYSFGGGGTSFNVPDLRGRMGVAPDSGSGRLSGSYSGMTNSNVLASSGGIQALSMSESEMPTHNHGGATGSGSTTGGTTSGGSTSGTTDTRLSGNAPSGTFWQGITVPTSGPGGYSSGTLPYSSGGYGNVGLGHFHAFSVSIPSLSVNSLGVFPLSISSDGSNASHQNMPPYLVLNYIIKL